MTFASKAQEAASERFFLVKLTPRRYIANGQLTAPNTYVFTIPTGLNIEAVLINNAAISSSNYVYVNDQLTITSLVNLELISNIVTVDHNIFLTGTKVRTTSEVSGIPDATWEPLIGNYPSFSQSMRNIAEGVFSLSNTDISLISTDRWGQSLLGKPDSLTGQFESLSNAPVSVWACIDSYADSRKIFDGEVSKVNYRYGELTLYVIDTFQKLTNSGSFGTRAQSHIYTLNTINGVTLYPQPNDENKVIPLTMGKSSPFSLAAGYKHVDAFGPVPGALYHLDSGQTATLVAPSGANQTSTTTWIAGRLVGSGVKRITFGGMFPGSDTKVFNYKKGVEGSQHIEIDGPDFGKSYKVTRNVYNTVLFCRLNNINNFTGEIGDYIPGAYLGSPWAGSGGVICGIGNNLHENYNLAISITYPEGSRYVVSGSPADVQFIGALSLPDNTIPSMSVWIEAGDSAIYDFEEVVISIGTFTDEKNGITTRYLPFTLLSTTPYTIGGVQIFPVMFQLDANSKLNVASSRVKCRFSPNTSLTHANALKAIVKSSGMDTNDATFSQADIDLAANVSVTFPDAEATEFGSYLDCAQAITTSTLGLLRVNQSRQVEYELIKNPTSLVTDGVRDSVNMLAGETNSQVEYQDMVSRVDFENPQLKNLASLSGTGPNATVDFPLIRQVHRIDRTKTVKHVLESIQNRKAAIAGYLASPTVEYSLATASEDLASSIGDIIEINNNAVADSSQTTKGVIVGLDQSGSTTNVKINEIRGVP
jgi:hypothetical protein